MKIAKRVLAVDDDAAILDLLKTSLEPNGYIVDLCEDENDLKISLAKFRPDIILMDASIPGVDGISLCRQIKHSPSTASVPVVIITAYDDEKTRHDALLFGADEFVSRPFDIKDLLKKMENLTERSR
ncbi:MAG: Response regulator MprA [Syntrophomonadaceae bacterium]|nr:Response regulator MprA [Bacillota bacterium]